MCGVLLEAERRKEGDLLSLLQPWWGYLSGLYEVREYLKVSSFFLLCLLSFVSSFSFFLALCFVVFRRFSFLSLLFALCSYLFLSLTPSSSRRNVETNLGTAGVDDRFQMCPANCGKKLSVKDLKTNLFPESTIARFVYFTEHKNDTRITCTNPECKIVRRPVPSLFLPFLSPPLSSFFPLSSSLFLSLPLPISSVPLILSPSPPLGLPLPLVGELL
jgi:hypothetical protein